MIASVHLLRSSIAFSPMCGRPGGGADWVIDYDGVHANKIGNLLIGNKIFEALAQHCSGLSNYFFEQEKDSAWTRFPGEEARRSRRPRLRRPGSDLRFDGQTRKTSPLTKFMEPGASGALK